MASNIEQLEIKKFKLQHFFFGMSALGPDFRYEMQPGNLGKREIEKNSRKSGSGYKIDFHNEREAQEWRNGGIESSERDANFWLISNLC